MALRLLSVLTLLPTAFATLGTGKDRNGVTQIFGNSFGEPGVNATYDYIIVGGGTAGNTIAARLALDPAGYSVAVIEAGSFYEITNSNRTQVPGYDYFSALANFVGGEFYSTTHWGLQTEPQAGYNGRRILYVAGQTFGGSSASNYMGYFRPTIGTFTQWASDVGDQFWSWANVYPFYKKSCHFTPPNYDKIDPSLNITYDPGAFQAGGGPLEVSYGNYQGPYGPPIEASLDRLGFRKLPGLNSGRLIGYGTSTATIDTNEATRSSSETSFLQLAAARSSIKIYPSTLGSKILFDANNRATGVLVQTNSLTSRFTYGLTARREVIVSAGTWHSPQLLMVSGVGPASTLRQHNIPIVADVPGLGQNAEDQPFMALTYKVNVTTGTQLTAGNPDVSAATVHEYLHNQGGLLSSIGAGMGVAFEKFPSLQRDRFSPSTRTFLSSFPQDWPEVEYLPLEYGSFPPDISTTDNYLTIGAALLTTSAKGNLTISSASILDDPVISPNWLLDVADQEQAVAAVERIRQIAFGSSIVQSEYLPGPDVNDRQKILAWCKDNMSLIYHATSTCKMGRASDPMAVVDSRARVRGVTRLRVVDASAFPFVPPGQPMSSVYMFAEKIAASILSGN